MARYLITGGCGFIGSHLANELIRRNHQVIVVDDLSSGNKNTISKSVNLVIGDIRDKELITELMTEVDGCFHLAATASFERSINNWSETHSINLSGTINILDAAKNTGSSPVPIVYASSAAVYGDNASIPLAERATLRPLTAYGADKLGSELHARIAGIVHNIPTIGFRLFNVYGPGQDANSPYSGVISIFSQRIKDGNHINVFGDGHQSRDFVYVKDVVRFLCKGMQSAKVSAPVFNVCSGEPATILQLAKTLFSIAGYSVPICYKKARQEDIQTSIGDPELTARFLNIRVQEQFGNGLKKTYQSLENQCEVKMKAS